MTGSSGRPRTRGTGIDDLLDLLARSLADPDTLGVALDTPAPGGTAPPTLAGRDPPGPPGTHGDHLDTRAPGGDCTDGSVPRDDPAVPEAAGDVGDTEVDVGDDVGDGVGDGVEGVGDARIDEPRRP